MLRLFAIVLVVGAAARGTPKESSVPVSATYEIDGKRVAEPEYEAKKRTLQGSFEYHCKKTTFGGVVTYKAHDRDGNWFEVTAVSGGTRPSSIERTDAPDADSLREGAKRYRVYKGDQLVLEITDAPGPLISTSAPPPVPGSKPPTHPFLSGTARVASEEGKLRALLDGAHSTAEYLTKLREAGYRVEELP